MTRLSLLTMPFIYSDDFVDDLLKINLSDGTLAWTYEAPTAVYDDAYAYRY